MTFGSRVLVAVMAALLLGSVSEAEAQRQRPQVWVMAGAEDARQATGPFAALLEHGSELDLTSKQLGRIREIQQRLLRENERLQAQIRDAEIWGVQTEEEEEALEAVREEFGENTSAAERRVEAVLTDEQMQQARELLGGEFLAYPAPAAEDLASGEAPDEAEPATGRVDAPALKVTVENQAYHDATLYVYVGARSQRLGFVTGLTTRIFTIPGHLLSGANSLRFQVRHLTRSNAMVTDEVMVQPGDQVLVRIPPV